MSSCCCPEPLPKSDALVRCPASGSPGKTVARVTVKALLTEAALQRLPHGDLRFCPDADCDVVYFNADGVSFSATDVRVAVWQKLPFGARQVCYCFGESEASILAEIELNGASAAVARIREHIAAGRCACDVRNPRGACCLGDVIAATQRVQASIAVDSGPEAASRPEAVLGG